MRQTKRAGDSGSRFPNGCKPIAKTILAVVDMKPKRSSKGGIMLDRRSPEEKRKEADKCYAGLQAKGIRSCAGCDLDCYCQMAKATAAWLFGTFLPKIDPANTLRWRKQNG